ncbi:hypothetical protein BLOT_003559 [Blomia tropicalis]|nr:hypothetical protein BLOT_003559 [Blomia tropicalis]
MELDLTKSTGWSCDDFRSKSHLCMTKRGTERCVTSSLKALLLISVMPSIWSLFNVLRPWSVARSSNERRGKVRDEMKEVVASSVQSLGQCQLECNQPNQTQQFCFLEKKICQAEPIV